MSATKIQFRGIPDAAAAMGWAGGHTIIADRPAGIAGGQGLGFSGGQLLGLAIGGCICNALQHVEHEMGVRLSKVAVDVTVNFSDNPRLATGATVETEVVSDDPKADIAEIVKRARAGTTVGNSLPRGIAITFGGHDDQ
jgi:organic hydroperoxide reductase OsmC/OhrA